MRKVKTYISMALIGAMALSFTGCNMVKRTAASIGKTVLAEVGDKKITRADVDAELKSTLTQFASTYGDDFEENAEAKETLKQYRENVVDGLIEKEVLLRMVEKLELEISEDDLNKYAEDEIKNFKAYIASQSGETDENKIEEEFVKYLDGYGYTVEGFTESCKDNYKINKVREHMYKDLSVSEDEIKAYYDENKDSYAREAGADAYNLLILPQGDGEEGLAKAEEKIKELREGIKTLDDFKKLADEHNTDDTKGKGGYLGYVPYENSGMVQEFADAFKDVKEGEVSEPVKTSYGWHLIMVENIHTEKYTPELEEVKEKTEDAILKTKEEQTFNDKIEQYKEEIGVKEYKKRL